MLHHLIDWAKHVPHFSDLRHEDQVTFCVFVFAFRNFATNGKILPDKVNKVQLE